MVVFDADGIYFLCKHPDLFPSLRRYKTFITANHNELARMKSVIELNIDHLLEFEIARDNNERRRTDTLSYHPNLILMCRQGSADLDVDATVN